MSVGLLIITHNDIGKELLNAATEMLGVCPLQAVSHSISRSSDPDKMERMARQSIEELDTGDGVLILTDAYGSTPSNISTRLLDAGRTRMVSGINLPMLIRVLNYPRMGLDALTGKALSGGNDGILEYHQDKARS
jgi:PTS system ascorbate-specific IIA component